MKFRKLGVILIIFFTCSLSWLGAQEKNTVASDSTHLQKLRESIPGETMGEKLESLLFWSQKEKEERFPMMYKLFPSSEVKAGTHVYPLPKGELITPRWEDKTTLADYMMVNHIAGVIVVQNGKIRLEKYAKNTTRQTLWTSFSVAKSVTSMLIGIALKDGYINSLDDSLQQYIPELKGADYGKVTIRELITMTSGINWNEDYDDSLSDVAQMYLKPCKGSESHILSYMKKLKFRTSNKKAWNYSTGEIDLAGILVQKATGKTLAEYLSQKIWQPMGMQQNSYWLQDECSDLNIGGSGLSATLRDFARLGQLMLNGGKIDGTELFSKEWLSHATKVMHPLNDQGDGYGYLWWCFHDGSYAAIGIFGQLIYINPAKNLVIAQVAAWPHASSSALSKKRWDFVKAVKKGLDDLNK